MDSDSVIVVGGGISGLSFAWKAASEGRRVRVLEEADRVGGCIRSERVGERYWFELGAHTTYNSYSGFLDVAVGTGAVSAITERGPARTRFGLLRDGRYRWLTPPRVLLELGWLEIALHAPRAMFSSKANQTVGSYYSRLLGPKNYARILGPFLSAVPSQRADGIPLSGAGSLFKKRTRRTEFTRSFGFEGGLQTVCDAAAAHPGVTVERGARVVGITRIEGGAGGYAVSTADGTIHEAPIVASAVPPDAAGAILREGFAEIASTIARVDTVRVESVGVVLPREAAWLPECAFVVPVGDSFFSCVTRDPFPDERLRAFAFHFRPETTRDQRLARVCDVLRVQQRDFLHLAERSISLPAPALGHAAVVESIDRSLAGGRLAVTGNFFDGLAIEDCVLRSFSEWTRVSTIPVATG